MVFQDVSVGAILFGFQLLKPIQDVYAIWSIPCVDGVNYVTVLLRFRGHLADGLCIAVPHSGRIINVDCILKIDGLFIMQNGCLQCNNWYNYL